MIEKKNCTINFLIYKFLEYILHKLKTLLLASPYMLVGLMLVFSSRDFDLLFPNIFDDIG